MYGLGFLTVCHAAASPAPTTEILSLEDIARWYMRKMAGSVQLPIVRQVTQASELRRCRLASVIGLSDLADM